MKQKPWKTKLHEIIYEADTPAGKLFDVLLLITILASIAVVMLESVPAIGAKYERSINIAEWIFTILFTIEYILRIISIKSPRNYIFSYYGIVDLLATIPKYLSLFIVGSNAFIVLRALRLLRVFTILKITRYIGEANKLKSALKASKPKITIFLFAVLILSFILNSLLPSGFTVIKYFAILLLIITATPAPSFAFFVSFLASLFVFFLRFSSVFH